MNIKELYLGQYHVYIIYKNLIKTLEWKLFNRPIRTISSEPPGI